MRIDWLMNGEWGVRNAQGKAHPAGLSGPTVLFLEQEPSVYAISVEEVGGREQVELLVLDGGLVSTA